MLVQFMVKNVLSFKEETVLDMTAIKAYKEHECNLIDIGMKEKFLRVAAIYGANASGKSNLYMAMSLFQRIIMESLNNVGEGEKNAIRQMRGHAPWYIKGLKSASVIKNYLSKVDTYQQMQEILEAYRHYLNTGDK